MKQAEKKLNELFKGKKAAKKKPKANGATAPGAESVPEPPKRETSIRSVYYDGQFLPALCIRVDHQPRVPCIASDPVNGIYLFHIPMPQHDKSEVVQHGYGNLRGAYPVDRYVRALREMLPRTNIPVSTEVRDVLRELIPDIDELRHEALATAQAAAPQEAAEPDPSDDTPEPPKAPKTKPGKAAPAAKPARSGPARTDGRELVKELSRLSGLPSEKVRAKLRAAGLRAPYVDPSACRKALGVK